MTWMDTHNPIKIKYYAFGAGDKEVNIMAIHVIAKSDMGQLRCREKVVNGQCVQDCHEQCNGRDFKAYIKCNHCYLRGSWQKFTFLVKKGIKTLFLTDVTQIHFFVILSSSFMYNLNDFLVILSKKV